MHVGFFDAFPHCTEVTPRPDDEEHEEQCQPCVEIERDCLQEEHKAIDGRVLRQGRADCRRPAGNGGDDTDRCRRRVDDVGELCARDLKLVRDGTHDGADGEAVEVVVDEDDDAEQHGDEGGAALPLDRARRPLAVGIHRTRARDGGDEDAKDDEKDQDVDVAPNLVRHDLKHRERCLQKVAAREEHGAREDADDERHIDFLRPEREDDGDDRRQNRPCGCCHELDTLPKIVFCKIASHYNKKMGFGEENLCLSCRLTVEAIARAPDGLEPLRGRGIGLDLFAETVHVDGNGGGVAHGIQIPDAVVERLLAEYNLRVLREKEQKLKLARGEVHLSPCNKDAMRPRLDLKLTEAQDRRRCLFAALEAFVARDMCLDACGELARAEGFYDVVIGTEPQRADLVHVFEACRDHEDGDVEHLAHIAADREAVCTGQHDIEQDEAVLARERAAFALVPVGRDVHGKAACLKIVTLEFCDVVVILDQQYFFHSVFPSFMMGSKSTMQRPPIGDCSARTLPPSAVMIRRTMASPSPLPAATFVRAVSVR